MTVILLNGPSSAGKSSIAGELKSILDSEQQTKIIALDNYLAMTSEEPIWEDDVYDVMSGMCEDMKTLLKEGNNIVIDHVIVSERIYRILMDSLTGHKVFKVLISCDADVLKEREKLRGNRCPGSAMASLEYLFPKTGYDLQFDSGTMTPRQIAKEIAKCLQLSA